MPEGTRGQGFKGSSEMLILLAGDLDLIEKGVLGKLKKDIAENKPLNP